MKCPRCQSALTALRGGGQMVIDYCNACGGTWYDAGEFEAFYTLWGPIEILGEGAGPKPGPPCPRCEVEMVEVTYPPRGGIRVDSCTSCSGLWLDKGEVSALRERLRSIQDAAARLAQEEESDKSLKERAAPQLKAAQETARGLHWRWVVLGFFAIVLAQLVVSGALLALSALDEMADKDSRLSEGAVTAISALVGFPIGGFLIGRLSRSFTVIEPAVAAVPAALFFAVRFSPQAGWILMAVIGVVGVFLSVLGAAAGEHRQRNGPSLT